MTLNIIRRHSILMLLVFGTVMMIYMPMCNQPSYSREIRTSGAGAPPYGTWEISVDTEIKDQTIFLNGSIQIAEGKKLTINHCTLIFMNQSVANSIKGALTNSTAELLVQNSLIRADSTVLRITSIGHLTVENSVIKNYEQIYYLRHR